MPEKWRYEMEIGNNLGCAAKYLMEIKNISINVNHLNFERSKAAPVYHNQCDLSVASISQTK